MAKAIKWTPLSARPQMNFCQIKRDFSFLQHSASLNPPPAPNPPTEPRPSPDPRHLPLFLFHFCTAHFVGLSLSTFFFSHFILIKNKAQDSKVKQKR